MTEYHDDTRRELGFGGFKIPSNPIFKSLPPTDDAKFDLAIQAVLFHEGIYSNDPDDPGGPTCWGWSLRTAKKHGDLDENGVLDFDLDGDGDVDINDIILLKNKPETAIRAYKTAYWDRYMYASLPPDVGLKVFDLSVNMGAVQAHKLLQRSIRACGPDRVIDDGIIGKKTLQAIRAQDEFALVCALRSHAAGFYTLLAHQNPKSRKYLNGWLNRAYF